MTGFKSHSQGGGQACRFVSQVTVMDRGMFPGQALAGERLQYVSVLLKVRVEGGELFGQRDGKVGTPSLSWMFCL